jgi:hypothetical protein
VVIGAGGYRSTGFYPPVSEMRPSLTFLDGNCSVKRAGSPAWRILFRRRRCRSDKKARWRQRAKQQLETTALHSDSAIRKSGTERIQAATHVHISAQVTKNQPSRRDLPHFTQTHREASQHG